MDRSLDEIVAERQRPNNRGGRRGGPPRRAANNYPRDGIRKPARDDRANLDNDWVHDRYDDEASAPRGGYSRPRGRRDEPDDRFDDRERQRDAPTSKIRVDNLHYDLTEDDLFELFSRLGKVLDVKLRYDRAGRSEGVAFVSYQDGRDANTAIREFDGANAKGQPIRLTLLQPSRRDNPFDRVENPKSLFDRIEAPRERRRSHSPTGDDRSYRRGPRGGNGGPGDRRSDMSKPAPENIDRYVPGQNGGRSDSRRGGRRPGERRERRGKGDEGGQRMVGGRPKKTQEELDAEMEDYWGNNNADAGANNAATTTPAQQSDAAPAANEIDVMIE